MYSADVDFGDGYVRVYAGGCSEEWAEVLALRPNPPAVCRGCGGAVTGVKEGEARTSHFKHLVEPDRCVVRNETEDHLRLKMEIAAAIDAIDGWASELEFPADGGGWVADVLAMSIEDSTRVAFEVQLASQDREWADERQRRRNVDGVECLWLVGPEGTGPTDGRCHLRSRFESVVHESRYNRGIDENGPTIERCEVGLADVVAAFLDGDLVCDRALRDPMRVDQYGSYRLERDRYKERQKRESEEVERRQRIEEWERRERIEEQTKKRMRRRYSDHYLKQMAVLGVVIDDLVAEHGRGIEVGEFTGSKCGAVVRSAEELDDSSLGVIDGSWEYAAGLRLAMLGEPFAVVCPNPFWIEASEHGRSLAGLTVYCHSSDLAHMEQVYQGAPIVVDVDLQG